MQQLPVRFGICTPADVDEIEKVIGFNLPKDYRTFFYNNNGGNFSKFDLYAGIYVPVLKQKVMLDTFYGYKLIAEYEDIELLSVNEEYKDEIPENSLLFTQDAGGNMFLLVSDTKNSGIYYWDNSYFFDSSDDTVNTYKVAENFSDFLNKIEYEEG